MIDAVIFDMDGVIVDSEPLHYESDKMTMKFYGYEVSDEELNNYVGVSNPEMWTELREKYRLTAALGEILEKQLSYKKILIGARKLVPIDGIQELLDEFRNSGIRIGLASSSSREFIDLVLEKLGIKDNFEVIVSGDDVKHSKPAPEIFLKASQKLNTDPSVCLVIEDSRHGIEAAKRAGMSSIGFYNPNSGSQDLSLADAIVYSIREIYPIISSADCTKDRRFKQLQTDF